jgi:hypothetical protein
MISLASGFGMCPTTAELSTSLDKPLEAPMTLLLELCRLSMLMTLQKFLRTQMLSFTLALNVVCATTRPVYVTAFQVTPVGTVKSKMRLPIR